MEAKKNRDVPHKPVGLDEVVVTMSVGPRNGDTQMLKYRNLFKEIPDNDVEAFFEDSARRHRDFEMVNLATEYCEDETGAPVSNYEMMQHVSGQEHPIIVGDPGSILRLGPVSAANRDDWSIVKANTIAQFLEVVERIHASKWYHLPHSITRLCHKTKGLQLVGTGFPDKPGSKLLEAGFPDDEDTMSVLAYFRQLHAKDKLVKKACEAYIAHSGDKRKRGWVNERQQSFESLIDSAPGLYNTNGKSRREIIRMVMYGLGMLHSSSEKGDDAVALKVFISQHGQHEAVMIFNSCLMDFLRVAATIHPVIHQDYHHWVNTDGLAAADRVSIPGLFRGFTSPPQGT